jgi:transcriptional regulator with XRE-family HTH domain
MDQTSIYRWERGVNQPDWDSLFKMCRVYGVRVHTVVDPERPVRTAKKPKTVTVAA